MTLVLAALLSGCGGKKEPTPATDEARTAAGAPAAIAKRTGPLDVRIVLGKTDSEVTSRPAADAGAQRVTLVNRTSSEAVLESSSSSGGASVVIAAGRSRTVTTGLEVSQICLGCMSFGDPARGAHPWSLAEEESRALIRQALLEEPYEPHPIAGHA